jgi:hypothetical protein
MPRDGRRGKDQRMPAVSSYSILTYGGPDGYQNVRAQIQLSDADGKTLAWLRFKDAGMALEADYETGGIIRMFLPSAIFPSIVDLLRNEKPIHIYFTGSHAFFGTSEKEPVGENE